MYAPATPALPSLVLSRETVQKAVIFLLRVAIGWVFLWAAIRQIPDAKWSAAQFLSGAKTFPGFYAFFLQPEILPITNVLVKYGHLLLGLSLMAGLCVRLSSGFGALLLMLYYFPRLDFPYVGGGVTNLIVEYHLVYALVLVYLGAIRAGRFGGLETWVASWPLFAKYPRLRPWIS
jgi:thiosulfate dehydrogenase [quinone] large subunit